MSRGFYELTSGMLTQQRKIDVSSNNIANINTAGYKKEQAVTSNFGSMLINKLKQNGIYKESEPIGMVSLIRTVTDNNTVHSQGSLEETGSITDFAILGQGFFGVDYDGNGNMLYTRNGSFNVDQEGYLMLNNAGRVQGDYGDVYIGTDKFDFLEDGSIIVDDEIIDRIAVYDFADYNSLSKVSEGMYMSGEEPDTIEYPNILNKTIERSNVDLTEEFTGIISSQRSLQTSSQAIKIYDLVYEMTVNEIAKI